MLPRILSTSLLTLLGKSDSLSFSDQLEVIGHQLRPV